MTPEALELRAALATIACAAELLRDHDDLFARYEREASLTDSLMPILNPTLWMNPERRQVDEAIGPLIRATRAWLVEVDRTRGLVLAFPDRSEAAPVAARMGA